MSKTVFLAKEEPGSVPGIEWTVGGEDGAVEVDSAYAEHLLLITDNDFFVVHPKEEKEEKKPAANAETKQKAPKPKLKTDLPEANDINDALKVADPTSEQAKE